MEHAPGDVAPADGLYHELNVFRRPSRTELMLSAGDTLSSAPVGFSWLLMDDMHTDV